MEEIKLGLTRKHLAFTALPPCAHTPSLSFRIGYPIHKSALFFSLMLCTPQNWDILRLHSYFLHRFSIATYDMQQRLDVGKNWSTSQMTLLKWMQVSAVFLRYTIHVDVFHPNWSNRLILLEKNQKTKKKIKRKNGYSWWNLITFEVLAVEVKILFHVYFTKFVRKHMFFFFMNHDLYSAFF